MFLLSSRVKRIAGSSKDVKNVGEKEGCLKVVDVELRLKVVGWRNLKKWCCGVCLSANLEATTNSELHLI